MNPVYRKVYILVNRIYWSKAALSQIFVCGWKRSGDGNIHKYTSDKKTGPQKERNSFS